ncbi:cop9 signalosome complex subunit 3 [Anaeramoeba flamelloides]|uniref:COP9 signalosome complex subunit 3 n=1 Tax=Anaeramoeba flamelloides TaxID=1746091 RepID=A0ABQ8X895_9EUKA|nr:cop9 signalosome complex subunit 3 [Anaeramoeba flamelloides]
MEKVLNIILQYSDTKEERKQLKNYLDKIDEQLTNFIGQLDLVMKQLPITKYSLGYMYLLAAKASLKRFQNPELILMQIQTFLLQCDPSQVSMSIGKFFFLCRRFVAIAIREKFAHGTVYPLKIAIEKIGRSGELTPTHAYFLQACLASQNFSAALPILESDVFEIDTKHSGIKIKDVLLYFYYGGMIYTGLKKYDEAAYYFELAVTIPADTLSSIMLESYRRYLLTSILSTGKAPLIPQNTSMSIQGMLKKVSKPYEEFVEAFRSMDIERVGICISTYMEVYEKDKTFGLIKLVRDNLVRRKIQRLTKTYITLSLEYVSQQLNMNSTQEAEFYLLDMIEQGEVFASIDQKEGQISFHADPEPYDSVRVSLELNGKIQEVIGLAKNLDLLDEKISTNSNFIHKMVIKELQGGGNKTEEND